MTNTTLAVWAMIGASALVAATSLIAKTLGQDLGTSEGLHPFMVSAGRFAFALATLLVFLSLRPRMRPSLGGANLKWHLARSICGWLGVTAMFGAAARMPLGEATAISFLSPLVTMILAIFLLGEGSNARKWIAAALAVIGALILLQPGTDAFQPAAILALAAALLFGVESIFIKLLSDSEPPLRILLINNTIGAAVSVTVATFVWSAPSSEQWLLLVALGAIMVTGQACFIQAMKRGLASVVIPVFYMTLVFAAVYDLLVFAERPTLAAILGAALIVGGAWITARTPAAASSVRTPPPRQSARSP